MTRYLLAAASLVTALPAMAQAPAPAPAQAPASAQSPACLRQINMYDFKFVPGNRALVVIDRSGLRYRVNFIGTCYDIQYNLGLRFMSHGTSGLSCLSKGDLVLFNNPAGLGRCIINDVQWQTQALDQKDAAQSAPKQH